MRSSDWRSDVCSSDLAGVGTPPSPLVTLHLFGAYPFRIRYRVIGRYWECGCEWNKPRNRFGMQRGRLTSEAATPSLCRNAQKHRHPPASAARRAGGATRSEEPTSELQSLMRISYAVFCLT